MSRILLFTCLLFCCFVSQAQDEPCNDECFVDQIIVDTGYDPVADATLPIGSYDPLWTVTASPVPGMSVPRPAFTIAPNPAWGTAPGTRWLSPFPFSGYGTNNPAPATPFRYENCFCICEPTELFIDLTVRADDEVDVYLVDDLGGTVQFLGSHVGFSQNDFAQMTATVAVDPGTYCLRADARNTGGVAMGINIAGTVSSFGVGLTSQLCCNNEGTITGTKYHDRDCDGERDQAGNINHPNHDPGLENWTIELCDSGNNTIATTTTDAFGLYTFNDVPAGTYTVKEVNQAGWTPGNPASGQQTVTVDALGIVTADFGNCETPCGGIAQDSIAYDCSDLDGYVYYFQIDNLTQYNVTSVVANGLPPGWTFSTQYWSSNGNPSLPIPSTATSGWLEVTIYPPAPITQPTELCFNFILLSGEYTCCHFEHCLTLEPLDPCADISVTATPRDSDEACCYDVRLENNFCEDFFTQVEAEILTPGIVFSQYSTGSAATLSSNSTETLITMTPTGGTFDLGVSDLSFCLDGIVDINQVPQLIAFNWYAIDANGEPYIACTDTLEFFCEPCLLLTEEVVNCEPDGTVSYTFTVTNNTLPAQTSTQVLLEVHTPGVSFSPALHNVTLLSGQSATLTVTVVGATPGTVVDYKVLLLDDTGWCCHLDGLSFVVPDCEGMGCECGPYGQFLEDALQGFVIEVDDCPDITLIPLLDDPCNIPTVRVRYQDITEQLAADAAGNFNYTATQNGTYQFCMEVQRFNEEGNACFPNQDPLVICEVIDLDCLNIDVPQVEKAPDLEDGIVIFPNPVDDELTIKLAQEGNYTVHLIDVAGRARLQRRENEATNLRLRVNTLPPGVYWVVVTNDKGESQQRRFVKR